MKKLIALLLALMLLCPTAVFADAADLYTLSEPKLTISMNGEESTMDLTGLKIAAAILDDGNTIAINLLGNDEVLLSGILKLDGDKILMTAEGLSNTYYIDKPDVELDPSDLEDANIDLSGIDFDALVSNLMESAEINFDDDGNITFYLPHTALNDLLEALSPLLDQIPEAALPAETKEEALSLFSQLKESDSGIDISGSVTGTDDGMAIAADVIFVNGSEQTEETVLSLSGSMTTAEDGSMTIQLKVSVADGESGELTEVANMNLQIGDDFSCTATILGEYEVNFAYRTADSIVEIGLTMEGMSYLLTMKAGVEENGEISICPVGDAASAINAEELTEEQSQQLVDELGTAASGLINFFFADTDTAEAEAEDDAA